VCRTDNNWCSNSRSCGLVAEHSAWLKAPTTWVRFPARLNSFKICFYFVTCFGCKTSNTPGAASPGTTGWWIGESDWRRSRTCWCTGPQPGRSSEEATTLGVASATRERPSCPPQPQSKTGQRRRPGRTCRKPFRSMIG
jgi:hypothetical protein